MASCKAASTYRGAKCAVEDAWLLGGNIGPIVDAFLWKRMYNGIRVYKGQSWPVFRGEDGYIMFAGAEKDTIHDCGG